MTDFQELRSDLRGTSEELRGIVLELDKLKRKVSGMEAKISKRILPKVDKLEKSVKE